MKGRYITGCITKLMKLVNVNGTGQRDFDFAANSTLITGLGVSTLTSLSGIFNAPHTYASTAASNESTLVVLDFNTANYITAPEGATHFRL